MYGGVQEAVASYLDWWADAGLVDPVRDAPRNWLERPPVAAAPAAPAGIQRQPAAPATPSVALPGQPAVAAMRNLPDTLDALMDWLARSPDLPGQHWSQARILPEGPQDARAMILADCPDPADAETGRLFAADSGRLLDAMLAAIGWRREEVRIASIALTRPPGGRLDGPEAQALAQVAAHHVTLARPRRLLIAGPQAQALMSGFLATGDTDNQRAINHSGRTMAAYAIHHPRLLIERPMLKRNAWDVLKQLRDSPD